MNNPGTYLRSFLVKIFRFFPLAFPCILIAQGNEVLTLHQAYHLAEKNYPLLRQKGLIKQTESLTVENLQTGYLPQFTLSGQATYQSDVTKVDLPLPGVKIGQLSKDQYRILGDVSQLLLDGGLINIQKSIQALNFAVDEAKVDVDLYQLKNRTVQIYFAILYQDELLKETTLHLDNIKLGVAKVEAQVKNGVALRSELQVLQAQLLQSNQRSSEIKSVRKGLIEALSVLSGQRLNEDVVLEKPLVKSSSDTINQRPELFLFQRQQAQLEQQKKLIDAGNLPKLSAFFQGGYGRPGLNMLSNSFDLFYVTGLRLNWSFGKLYNSKRDKQLIDLNKQAIELQRETFLLNTHTQLAQQRAEIEKFEALVDEDKAIVDLRKAITQSAKAQLNNSVITANDYLREVNAEDAARQTSITHQLQLLQAQVNYQLLLDKL
jgi:outer membrane protein TolC